MKTVEVAPNIFITNTIADSIENPASILDELESLPVRVVGGLHNLTARDKFLWACKAQGPLRVIERGTEREEIWFPNDGKHPSFITLNSRTGMVQSHQKFKSHLPAVEFGIRVNRRNHPLIKGNTVIDIWYNDGLIHSFTDENSYGDNFTGSAISSGCFTTKLKDKKAADYMESVSLHRYREVWDDGNWIKTCVDDIEIQFKNARLNDGWTKERVFHWIKKHCKHGFFPFSENLFGDEEEEFMFIADICSS